MENPEKKGAVRKLPKPNNIFNVPVTMGDDNLEESFFRQWCIFLRPFISLTEKEIDVVASFLKQRWELSKIISDPAVLDTMMASSETIKKVVKECHVSVQHFYVIMSTLRKKGVVHGNLVDSRLIPNTRVDDNGVFQLLILFKDKTLQ